MKYWEGQVVEGQRGRVRKGIPRKMEPIIGLARNQGLGKFPGIHKDDPS